MDWQPIATAPRNKTWVLLKGGTVNYGWDADSKPPMVCAQFVHDKWQFAWYDCGYYGEYENPTHWRPVQEDREP